MIYISQKKRSLWLTEEQGTRQWHETRSVQLKNLLPQFWGFDASPPLRKDIK
jgi:hypothetical protein